MGAWCAKLPCMKAIEADGNTCQSACCNGDKFICCLVIKGEKKKDSDSKIK